MKIKVLQCDWGTASLNDIKILLDDVASHLTQVLRTPIDGTIEVMNLPDKASPEVFYRKSSAENFLIQLATVDEYWCQYAYQFAHELCHVLSEYERLKDNPNNWFHEAICELASLFVLRRMAERWPSQPPFANWADYSTHLADYATCKIDKFKAITPQEPFKTWVSDNEAKLRKDPYLRNMNGVVALWLLPLFEEHPAGWNAVRYFPTSEGMIDAFIDAWKHQVDDEDRLFVEQVESCLGFTECCEEANMQTVLSTNICA